MRFCAGTGLIVDIVSTGGAAALPSQGELPIVKTIALRADMDALRMTEGNLDLPHRSQNEGVAHMCGHDGHTAALVGAAACIARRASTSRRAARAAALPAGGGGPGRRAAHAEGGLPRRHRRGVRNAQLADGAAGSVPRQGGAADGARLRL